MTSGSKVANKHQKVQLKKKNRYESDEDYMVEVDDEFDDSDAEYPYSLDNDYEDKEEDVNKVKRIGRHRGKRSCPRRDKNGDSYREEGEDSDCNDSDEDEEFRQDEIGGDEELPFMKKSKVNRLSAKRKIQKRKQITEAREIFKSSTTDSRSSSLVKEKERMVGMKVEEGKQVCGICLSEEGKTTVRGKLNSCSHYFCFPCIMEWSKVESRCPLCKQRFTAITRSARRADEHTSAGVTVPIPELDQVYQPSAEELRRYLDPYEDVVCTECNEGGYDALMLLCDLCDSSAHTYCVGLGCEVPEGNWYCLVCRPTILASSNEPQTPYHEPTLPSPSPRHYTGVSQAASPFASVAFTVSERRRIQQQIHHLVGSASRIGLFGSQISHEGAARLPYYPTPLYGDVLHHRAYASAPDTLSVLSPPEFSINNSFREVRQSRREKEHVQSMVRSHLRSFSRDLDLGYVTFKKIARTSTHTILAAFGLEHRRSEVYPINSRPLNCNHIRQTYPVADQCYSCLDWFVNCVVGEMMSVRRS